MISYLKIDIFKLYFKNLFPLSIERIDNMFGIILTDNSMVFSEYSSLVICVFKSSLISSTLNE